MSSAKLFSQSLLRAGRNAVFSKTDISDAYKLIPCHPTERPFFGFTWLGKLFFDISTPFGSKAAPANFDDFAETIVNICTPLTGLSREWIHRQLDDVPVVTPCFTTATQTFFTTYKQVCEHLNIPLAADDPNRDKTFTPGVTGTVLGLWFDSRDLTWQLPETKWAETMLLLREFFQNTTAICLHFFQQLHGKLNAASQLAPVLKGFTFHQTSFLQQLAASNLQKLPAPPQLCAELTFWSHYVFQLNTPQPIPWLQINPPYRSVTFMSDAAGPISQYSW